ncbi:MAG: IS200/IS605 family element transposase accessory protein TnpB [Nitrososphaeria archaeon]|nr:IS200/IS605 family element transposase accessory protein TnpB [Nitrososphaeria archaeon]
MAAVKCIQIPIVPLVGRKERTLSELLKAYSDIVQQSIDYTIEMGITSRKRLHEALYEKLRAKYPNLASHYIYTSFTMALGICKSFKKRKKLGLTKRDKPEVSNLNSLMLDDYHLFKIEGKVLRLNIGNGHLYLPLKPTRFQERFLEEIRQGAMLVKRGDRWFLNATIKRDVQPYEPIGIIAYDINEKSVDALLVKEEKTEWIHIDISEAKHIQKRYQEIRERKRRYIKGKARRKANNILHVATKFLVEKALEEKVVIVTEDIKGINKGINRKGKGVRRRLNLWSHGKISFQMNYKADWLGVPRLKDVDAKNNSKTCPVCGDARARKGWVFKCKKCGYETSSHQIACINILKKALPQMSRVGIPFSAKALVGLSPKWLVATVKGTKPVREGLHRQKTINIYGG